MRVAKADGFEMLLLDAGRQGLGMVMAMARLNLLNRRHGWMISIFDAVWSILRRRRGFLELGPGLGLALELGPGLALGLGLGLGLRLECCTRLWCRCRPRVAD